MLVISIVAFGLWMALTHAPSPSGITGSSGESGAIDPDCMPLYLNAADAPKAVEIAKSLSIPALIAGHLEQGAKRVVIEPLGVEFGGDELQLR